MLSRARRTLRTVPFRRSSASSPTRPKQGSIPFHSLPLRLLPYTVSRNIGSSTSKISAGSRLCGVLFRLAAIGESAESPILTSAQLQDAAPLSAASWAITTRRPAQTADPHPCHQSPRNQRSRNQEQVDRPNSHPSIQVRVDAIGPRRKSACPKSGHPPTMDHRFHANIGRPDARESRGAHPPLELGSSNCFAHAGPPKLHSASRRPHPPADSGAPRAANPGIAKGFAARN